jgi:hypothetical protein
MGRARVRSARRLGGAGRGDRWRRRGEKGKKIKSEKRVE